MSRTAVKTPIQKVKSIADRCRKINKDDDERKLQRFTPIKCRARPLPIAMPDIQLTNANNAFYDS